MRNSSGKQKRKKGRKEDASENDKFFEEGGTFDAEIFRKMKADLELIQLGDSINLVS